MSFDTEIEKISTEFVKFYYNELNLHSDIKITNLYKGHSVMIFQDEKLYGNINIINKLKCLFNQNICYNVKHIDFLYSGAKKINILITGEVTLTNLIIYKFTEFIHLANGNDGLYWIPANIFRIVD